MFDLVCVGETLVDFVTTTSGAGLDEEDTFRALVGGTPTNVALTARRLGAASAIVACVGDDPLGDRARKLFDEAGVKALLSVAENRATTAAVVVRSSTTPGFVILRGADAMLASVPDEAFGARWMHTSAFALSHEPQRSAIVAAVQRAVGAGITTSIDVNYHRQIWHGDPSPLLSDLIPLFDVIKVSVDDCDRLFGPADTDTHLSSLRAWGAQSILLTQGGDPVIFESDGATIEALVAFRNVVDVTGAGDALMAGFIIATLDGLPPAHALAVGVATAGLSVEVLGHIAPLDDRAAFYDTVQPV